MTDGIEQVLNELKAIRVDINIIKQNMSDKDRFLTNEEEALLGESFENEKKGELVSSQTLRRHLGI